MLDPEMDIREARMRDLADLVALINDAYGRTTTPSGWTSEDGILAGPRAQRRDVREILAANEGTMLVAHRGDEQPVGCVHVDPLDDATSEIAMLSVHPRHQAQGLGRLILARAEAHARTAQDVSRVVLHVLSVRKRLLAWYERRGYEPTGESEPFEPDEPQRSLIGPLTFEVLAKELA